MPQEQNEPEEMEEDVQEREMELFAETETPKRSERGEGIFTPPKDSAQVYRFPPVSLLNPPPQIKHNVKQDQTENIEKLESTLRSFGIGAQVENITIGPAITRYELTIARGVRVNRIAALADDIAPVSYTHLRTDRILRIATKYPNIALNYFNSRGRSVEIIKLNGSVELGPVTGLSDVILDIVELSLIHI